MIPRQMPHPTNNLKRVLEVRLNTGSKEEVVWHLMWNHPSGPGGACGAEYGCFTLDPNQSNCEKCREVNESEEKEVK